MSQTAQQGWGQRRDPRSASAAGPDRAGPRGPDKEQGGRGALQSRCSNPPARSGHPAPRVSAGDTGLTLPFSRACGAVDGKVESLGPGTSAGARDGQRGRRAAVCDELRRGPGSEWQPDPCHRTHGLPAGAGGCAELTQGRCGRAHDPDGRRREVHVGHRVPGTAPRGFL